MLVAHAVYSFILCGATLATYAFSTLIRSKFEVSHIVNASLVGGVAMGGLQLDSAKLQKLTAFILPE